MKVNKKVLGTLNKCYALARVEFDGKNYLACAAEKEDPCYLYDYEGNFVEKLWDGPGGVMSLEQYPNQTYPTLLATWKFYSPNNGADSKIVYYLRKNGEWQIHTLCKLPFVHRFGVIERNHQKYLVACTLKSAHAFKDDWTCPGRVWVAKLPEDISIFDEDHQLELTPLISGLTQNHGFFKTEEEDYQIAIVGTKNGIFKVVPPADENGEWIYEQLTTDPASDMLYLDFDQDGQKELMTFAPFHGDTLAVYKLVDGSYQKVWEDERKMPFLHAIYPLEMNGKVYGIYGYRRNELELNLLSYDKETNTYVSENLDRNAGPTNALAFKDQGVQKIFVSNRETDEIALYTIEE